MTNPFRRRGAASLRFLDEAWVATPDRSHRRGRDGDGRDHDVVGGGMAGRRSKVSREALPVCASRRGVRARIVPLRSARSAGGGGSKTRPREGWAGRWSVKSMPGQRSAASAAKAKQGAEMPARANWMWVEASVWTERMLSALVTASKAANGCIGQMPSSRMPGCSRFTRPGTRETVSMKKPPTGEPYAGKPPVRFGGRGGESLPYPYQGPPPQPYDLLDCFVPPDQVRGPSQ